jgi:electron transfer flavoprotein beta subunit
MKITVCWKWVAVDLDRSSSDEPDGRWAGVSLADRAALELALRIAGDDGEVDVVGLAPAGAEHTLREALAAGATRTIRIDAPIDLPSRDVAASLAAVAEGSDLVVAGDQSVDRGTGSVPAFIAAELRLAQALGLVRVELPTPSSGEARVLRALRRLDGGRREVLEIPLPAVLSVEGAVATLRRASLTATLAASHADIVVIPRPAGEPVSAEVHPYRPRARALRPPHGDTRDRVRELLHLGAPPSHAETVVLDPPAAAERILDQLRAWGYLEAGS